MMSASLAAAQDYPNRTVTIVVPFAPGGANDVVMRAIQQPLTDYKNRCGMEVSPTDALTVRRSVAWRADADGRTC